MSRAASIITICGFIFQSTFISGQMINLDEQNGISDFKFGDSLDKWKSQLSPCDTLRKKELGCYYTGDCCKHMFGSYIASTYLIFESNKLVCIELIMKDSLQGIRPPVDFLHYAVMLQSYFQGAQRVRVMDTTEGRAYHYQWVNSKVVMDLTENYRLTTDMFRSATLRFFDKNYMIRNDIPLIDKESELAECEYALTLPDTLRDKKLMAFGQQLSGIDSSYADKVFSYIGIKPGIIIKPTRAYFDNKVSGVCNFKNYKLTEIEIVPDTLLNPCPFESICVMVKFKFEKGE